MKAITENTLYYGDNLDILREHFIDECVDLVYLDPPFNSNRNYNVLFKDEQGLDSEAQILAFTDTWHWTVQTEHTYSHLITHGTDKVATMLTALRSFIGANQMMAYLVMMTARLVELHRVLKPTGSLYLHCDPTASHYLKIILDGIFNYKHFRNEIVWCYANPGANTKIYSRKHDVILFYTKSDEYHFNMPRIPHKSGIHNKGRAFHREYDRDIDKMVEAGKKVEDWWVDIFPVNRVRAEVLGYPTQKPLALLERIISASSNPADVILDPFCGCGTAIAAAQKLDRKWIGIDITHLSIALQKYRLESMFPGITYTVKGEPTDTSGAHALALHDRYQFQFWALSLIHAKPLGGQEGSKMGKKGSDKGIDGSMNFVDDASGKGKRVIVQVKSGHVKSGDIRDLVGTVQREEAAIGVFLTLEPPTKDMRTEAASAGLYHSVGWGKDYPRIQIVSIAELFAGVEVKMPPQHGTFKSAQRVQKGETQQASIAF